MRALVVGAGVAGAAAAVALRRIGAEVTVYEAYEDPAGPYGSFISLAGNGLRGLRALGCLRAVQQAGFSVERQRMWSAGGKLLGDVPRGRRAHDPMFSVTLNRSALVSALRQEAIESGARIVTGQRVTPDEQFAADADLVVGADGIWSATRRSIDPAAPEPRYAALFTASGVSAGDSLTTGAPSGGSEAGFKPASFNMTFGPRGAFIHLPAPDGSVWWSAQVAAPTAPDLTAITAELLRAQFAAAPTVDRILLAARPDITTTLNHVLDVVPVQSDDRTILIGDAAHPVGAGQGASMAIEDAVILAGHVGVVDNRSGTIAGALSAFVEQRRDRLGKLARSASSNRDAKTAGPLTARLRDVIMPFTFNRFYERATGWLYDFDPGTLPARPIDRAAQVTRDRPRTEDNVPGTKLRQRGPAPSADTP